MDTAYISKDDLDKLIEITKNTPKWRFAFAKFKRLIKTFFISGYHCRIFIRYWTSDIRLYFYL